MRYKFKIFLFDLLKKFFENHLQKTKMRFFDFEAKAELSSSGLSGELKAL